MDDDHRDSGGPVGLPAAEKGKRDEDVGMNNPVFNEVMNTRLNQRKDDKPPRPKQ